jgi:hypothetical protein
MMSQTASVVIQDNIGPRRVAKTIGDRLSQELIIALVGPIASGVSTAAKMLSDLLSQKYGYDVCPIIKPSSIIRNEARRVGKIAPSAAPLGTYVTEMQTIGNDLRAKFGSDYLAEKSVEQIVRLEECRPHRT